MSKSKVKKVKETTWLDPEAQPEPEVTPEEPQAPEEE